MNQNGRSMIVPRSSYRRAILFRHLRFTEQDKFG
jgi:hypothetical protein